MRRVPTFAITSALFGIIFVTGCVQQYKPTTLRGQAGQTAQGTGPKDGDVVIAPPTDKPVALVVSNTKLATLGGTMTAKISYGGQNASQDFTPTGAQSTLDLGSLPAGPASLMTVEIYQGQVLKFVAKKAKTSLVKSAANTVIIDDCLILPAPWQGTVNDGSCEWTVTEVAN